MSRNRSTGVPTAICAMFVIASCTQLGQLGTSEDAASSVAAAGSSAVNPFAEPARPPEGLYNGPLFKLSADYPTTVEPHTGLFPWQAAIGGGRISVENADKFAQALKDAVAPDMTTLLYDYKNWDAAAAGWYNQPWISKLRDGIHGTYQGSTFSKEMFPVSKLADTMTTHVLVYYDKRAAASMGRVWGKTAMNPLPALRAGKMQFPEGGLLVKPAFTTADSKAWPPVEGAATWPIWTPPSSSGPATFFDASLFQFDIIVKDQVSSPKSQWVFMTLVYDKDATGATNWDKMVPLGVMWGNDPKVVSPMECNYLPNKKITCPPLSETWINPEAPIYAKETLGWGGRLSGPNDGAVDIDAAVLQPDGTVKPYSGRYAMSSCMGCHGSASFEMASFLLPSPANCSDDGCSPTTTPSGQLVYFEAGSAMFREWFQNRAGDVPQVPRSIALDYGMNYAFKSLPEWFSATNEGARLNFIEDFNDYRGVSPDHFAHK